MEYRYHTLITVLFSHTYFSDNRYTGFTVEPDMAALHDFKRLSLLFRQLPNGFSILYETKRGLERTRDAVLNEPVKLGFRLVNNDADFINYTADIPTDITNTVLFLHNTVNAQGGSETGLLHPGDFVSVKDILQNQPPDINNPDNREFFVKPYGWLEITLHNGLENTLYANFKGKETVWRYILNSEHLQDLTAPAIINKDTKEVFTGPVWVVLPDGKKRMSFESPNPIALCSKPEKVYQLVENYQPASGKYKVVLGVLPNPNVKLISLIDQGDQKPKNIFSEIFI